MPTDIYFIVEYFSGESDSLIFQTDDASNVARVGRASRVGTRAGRYIKLVKLIKIVKVGKFFSQANKIQNKREESLAHKIQQQKEQELENNSSTKDLKATDWENDSRASKFLMQKHFFRGDRKFNRQNTFE